ncbi:MAG: lysophospholipid acyltransferase family protein [Gammaproteobacteria bacterium]
MYIRSSIYWLLMVLSGAIIGFLTVFTFPFPVDKRYRFARSWAVLNLWLLRHICKLTYEVDGMDNITRQGVVVLCKHQSTWDTMILQVILPPVRWVLKRELLRVPFFGWGLAMMKPIAIDRAAGRKAVAQLIEQGRPMLDDGYWVIVFPEGTRTHPGEKKRYKQGGSILAVETGHPVVPIAHNAGEFWPRHSFLKWPGTISLRIGAAIDTRGKSPEQVTELAHDWIEGQMEEISDSSRWNR